MKWESVIMKLRSFPRGDKNYGAYSSFHISLIPQTDEIGNDLKESFNSPVFDAEGKIIFVVVGDSLANQEHQSIW